MADYLAIGDAIAARFAALTPPAGQSAIRVATARPPNALPATPFVAVWLQSGEDTLQGSRLLGQADYTVAFHLAQHRGDVPRDIVTLTSWAGVLRTALLGSMTLGLAPVVAKALVTSWQLAVLSYAGTEYDGLTLSVRVWTTEGVTVAP